ncbi:LysE family transporter [Falsiroseomonas oryziterrae]|uniref:LysE family transporter n=1 Tax=Falsiroseomonas oryziterrae TaxID=2911368 RepID=UPI001F01A2BE|nr:LysE family transporter [Roseomonas sp. NPKOSM-4]
MSPPFELALPAAPQLAKFALGYLAVLASPGPNMLAMATLSALRGFRGVLPFVVGIASGAGTLALLVWMIFDALPDVPGLEVSGRAIGAFVLLLVALRVARTPPMREGPYRPLHADGEEPAAAFGAGFGTAVMNPVTAAYCAAQFVGPLAGTPGSALAPTLVLLQVLLYGLLVATLFARPAMRSLAIRHHRRVCTVSALVLAVLAVVLVTPLLAAG